MSIETEVANLTAQTTALLSSVNIARSTLDQRVTDAATQAGLAGVQASNAASSTTAANASAGMAAGSAASALEIYGTTAVMQAKLDEAKAQSNTAQTAAASASSVLQQDLSGVSSAALHRSPNPITAQFIYDTSLDSDGGAWVERMQHTSWFNEPLCGTWRGQVASEAAARAISGAATGDYFQLTTDGKFYKLSAGAGITEVFRGNKAKFPRLSAVVAEAGNITIYSLDQPGQPMWMRFVAAGSQIISSNSVTSVAVMGSKLAVGGSGGMQLVDFVGDYGLSYQTQGVFKGRHRIAQRNTALGVDLFYSAALSNNTINAVAMTVLPDAPVDAVTGLPVPTIAVATAGGASVIKHDGTMVSKTWAPAPISKIAILGTTVFTSGGSSDSYWGNMSWDYISGVAYRYGSGGVPASIPFVAYNNANGAVVYGKSVVGVALPPTVGGPISFLKENKGTKERGAVAYVAPAYSSGYLLGDIRRCYLANTEVESVSRTLLSVITGWTNAGYTTFIPSGNSVTLVSSGYCSAVSAETFPVIAGRSYLVEVDVAWTAGTVGVYFGNAGNTSSSKPLINSSGRKTLLLQRAASNNWQIGLEAANAVNMTITVLSIEECKFVDRSCKAAGAGFYGTLVKTQVAAAAQLVAHSGFSATNYIQEPYSADLDFGTGEWQIAAWVNCATAVVSTIAHRGAATGPSISLGTDATGKLTATAYDGTTTLTVTTDAAYNTGVFTKVTANYRAGKLWIEVSGLEVKSVTGAPLLTLTNESAVLTIGNSFALDASFPGSIALLKLGATVPTVEQALWMYGQEKRMFQDGAQVTLPSSSAVIDLAYDDAQDKWVALQPGNESSFTGLVRTASVVPSAGSFSKVNTRSGIKLQARTTTNPGVDVSIPAYGLREELVRRAEEAAKASKTLTVFDFDAVAAQTDFVLPVGWTATEVTSAGASQREGATKQFVRLFDGFRETIRFAVAPGAAAWIQINARKE